MNWNQNSKNAFALIQDKINNSSGISRIILSIILTIIYFKILKYRNKNLIITSQGNPIFWIFAFIFLKNYSINIISCAPFNKKGVLRFCFNIFIKKSKFITFTDNFYKNKYLKSGLVIHDRNYRKLNLINNFPLTEIKILGHIHNGRNPIKFINKYVENYKILIIGKINTNILKKLPKHKNLIIINEYISDSDYLLHIRDSYVYLPVTECYSNVMISGVFFDVIEGGGIPIIKYHSLYKEYIDNNVALDENNIFPYFNFNYRWYEEKICSMNQETLSSVSDILQI